MEHHKKDKLKKMLTIRDKLNNKIQIEMKEKLNKTMRDKMFKRKKTQK